MTILANAICSIAGEIVITVSAPTLFQPKNNNLYISLLNHKKKVLSITENITNESAVLFALVVILFLLMVIMRVAFKLVRPLFQKREK